MFDLALLLILFVYIALLREFVRDVVKKRRSGILRSEPVRTAIAFVVLVLLPAWYFLGFFFSAPYWDFKRLCEEDAGFHVVSPRPTRTVFTDDCEVVQNAILSGMYDKGVCTRNSHSSGTPFAVKTKGAPSPECRGSASEKCFDFEPTHLPTHAYDRVNEKEERSSVVFASALVVRDFQFVDQQGGLLAYNRSFRHYPLGTGRFAAVFGFASGQPPSAGCLKNLPADFIQQIYPPLAEY